MSGLRLVWGLSGWKWDVCEAAELNGFVPSELARGTLFGFVAPKVPQRLGSFGEGETVALILRRQDIQKVVVGLAVDGAGNASPGCAVDQICPRLFGRAWNNRCIAQVGKKCAQTGRGHRDSWVRE